MAPSPDPQDVQWVWDYIPHYRFNPEIITSFLQSKWRDYDEFFVEVRALCKPQLSPAETAQEVGKQFRFWVPRKLRAVRSSVPIKQSFVALRHLR